MANIDYFKQDVVIGDTVAIELTSGKTVTGKVLEINDCIIVEKDEGKHVRLLDGIVGGWEVLSHQEMTETNVKTEAPISEKPAVIINPQLEEKKEPQYGLKIVGKIDLAMFDKPKRTLSKDSEKVEKSKLEPTQSAVGSIPPHNNKKRIGNGFDALDQITNGTSSKRKTLSLTPMGRITKIGHQYGYIYDEESQKAIRFDVKDLIGEFSDFDERDLVVYTVAPNWAYGKPQANKVINLLDIDEILSTSRSYIESGDAKNSIWAKSLIGYVLKEYPKNVEAENLMKRYFGIETLVNNVTKPSIVTAHDTINALPLKLPPLSEFECKDKERELDLLIRSGQREECLQKSYEILHKRCPTPKYLKSYLDRIVNTEVALGHTQEAIEALGQLIAYSETQDTKATNLAHLYVSLGRLLKQQGLYSEAIKALDSAQLLTPNSSILKTLRNQIKQDIESKETQAELSFNVDMANKPSIDEPIVVSKMLQQDVEYRTTSMDDEDSDPDKLLARADGASRDSNKTFELRAQLFLDAAASYVKKNKADSLNYKKAVANYARFKGNSMYTKLQNSIQRFPDNIDDLIAYCDSACNYYTEALGIYNGFGQKRYLQELFLKYLKLKRVSSQIQGGKTPDSDWTSGTLKSLQKECISDVRTEDFKAFASTCIAVGSAAEGAWNSLSNDKDGISPFTWRLSDPNYRAEVCKVFNSLEQSNIDITIRIGDFLHSIFAHRQERIKQFGEFLSECLKWQFTQFEIEVFKERWEQIDGYSDILSPTDLKVVNSINQVIMTLKPYAEVNATNRMQRLISAQQTLIKSIDIINDTTTYYGRTFFYKIENQWLKSIGKSIEEKYAETQPQLVVEPDPHFIKTDQENQYYVNFVVINRGGSTADSFDIKVTGAGTVKDISYIKTIEADKSISLSCPIFAYDGSQSINIKFEVMTNYNGRTLPSSIFELTYEKDENRPFESEIPWTIGGTPEKNVFVGRQNELDKLLRHYLSKERAHTYIMYGLTRTGKTSILDYLRKNINDQPLEENPNMVIKAFSWPFQHVAYKLDTSGINENRFWEYLIKTSLYDKLPENLQDVIDASYNNGNIPDVVGQNDFMKIIDILNKENIMPFFAVDEFSYVKQFLDGGTLNASFLSILRDLSLTGKACFIYAGTYDIEELPKNEKYGFTGQLAHTFSLPIDRISDEDAEKLIDSWGELEFEPRAKEYIKNLSGCIPYWIQWICLDCGKYAISHNYHHLGYNEVNKVVQILTGEASPTTDKLINFEKIGIENFRKNQYMQGENEDAESAVISCIAYLNRNNYENARGVSINDMKYLWDRNYVSKEFQQKMLDSIRQMSTRRTLSEYTDEGRVVYRLNVDLFRRYWFVKYPNYSSFLTSK